MNHFYPITIPTIQWDFFKTALAEANRNIDSIISRKDYSAFIKVVGASSRAKGHLNYTFAFIVDNYIIEYFRELDYVTTRLQGSQLIIVTANVHQWIEGSLVACQPETDYEIRVLFNKIIFYFDNIGLKEVTNPFIKQPLKDNTFILKRT